MDIYGKPITWIRFLMYPFEAAIVTYASIPLPAIVPEFSIPTVHADSHTVHSQIRTSAVRNRVQEIRHIYALSHKRKAPRPALRDAFVQFIRHILQFYVIHVSATQ